MTDKLHCPFCGAELEKFGGGDFPLLHYCDNINCNLYHIMGQYTLWQELIRTRKALGIATGFIKGISQTVINDCDNQYVVLSNFKKFAQDTLDEITALEQKDKL